ncbi:MAG: hypothetical protein EBU33_00855 [Sphingobacteriia bacterium]|nr:hypothetical protein [Sphingobacteriia bacterium]
MKHEMDQSEVLSELLDYDWVIREIELAFQAHARDGLIRVQQLSGGMVGQIVTIIPRVPEEPSYEVGQRWLTYNCEQMQHLADWGEYAGHKVWTDEVWSEHYGTWKEDVGNGLVRIRIMIQELPPSLFDGFEHRGTTDHYARFPDFIPIEVIVPSWCVVSMEVPLDQIQIAVKYNFEEDIIFARTKVEEIALADGRAERSQIVAEFMEFLIIKPTMLIHSYKLRTSIYSKLDEFMVWMETCDDSNYRHYIYNLVDRMSTVLSMVLQDPLCVK